MKMATAHSDSDCDEVDEIKGMTELYNPGCCLTNSVKEDSDLYSKATDLDGTKRDLLTTYLDFNRNLWTGKIKDNEKPQTEETIRKKLKIFQQSVGEYYSKDVSMNRCSLYHVFEISGVSRRVKRKTIQSALTNIINFPDCIVSLKTAKSKSDKKDLPPKINKSWKEATQDYLDKYYPTEGVFRIPPSLETEDELKESGSKTPLAKDLLLVPDDKALENRVAQSTSGKNKDKVIEGFFQKRKGDKAESKILIAFEKWGRDTKQNMFIFGGYNYSDYLKNVTSEFKSLTSEQGEFDVLIISEQLGVIFVEVKGSVGAEHVTTISGRQQTGFESGFGTDATMIEDKTKERNNYQCNVTSRDRQDSRECGLLKNGHNHKAPDSAVDHIKSERCNPSDTLDINRHGKPASLGTCSDGSACENPLRNVVPKDTPKCELGRGKDIASFTKTTSHTIQSEIQVGWRQLMKGNFVFREMNRELSFVRRLPFKSFVGLPFLSLSDLNHARICNHHQRYLICSESLDHLQDWLQQNHFSEGYNRNAMSREEFRELVARFAGLASAVISEIDTIKFTKRKMMCTFLTPEQTAILHNEQKHAVLFGDYGTGKTLVLTRKAKSLVFSSDAPPSKSGNKKQVSPTKSTIDVVHIIPCADVSNFKSCYRVTFSDQAKDIEKFVKPGDNINIYKSFLDFYRKVTKLSPDSNVEAGIEMVIHAVERALHNFGKNSAIGEEQQDISNWNSATEKGGEIERAIGEEVRERKVVHHFFFDEFPIHPLKGGELQRLQKFFVDCLKDSYLWISVATHSLGVSSDEKPSKVLGKALSIEDDEDVFVCYLKDVMRISKEVYKMIKEIETFIDKGHFNYSNLGHMLKGIKPRLFRLPKRKCESPEYNSLGCECQVENLASTLRRILDAAVDKYGEPLVVTIMIYYVMSTPMFRRLQALLTRVEQVLNIELIWNTMQSRYTEENLTEFTDGLSRKVDSISLRMDAIKTTPTMIGNGGLERALKTFRSPCPGKGGEKSKLKKPYTNWKVQVVDQRTFAGCETPVLIFIDLFGMRHWFKRGNGKGSGYHSLIFTRCTGLFNLITWSDDEADKMWHQHLDEYETEVRESDASESYKKGRYEYINTGRNATENCLQMLLDKDLIIKMNMEQTE